MNGIRKGIIGYQPIEPKEKPKPPTMADNSGAIILKEKVESDGVTVHICGASIDKVQSITVYFKSEEETEKEKT